MSDDKRSIRSEVRAARCALTPAERQAASLAVAARALGLPVLVLARTVLAYWPTPEELDPRELMGCLSAQGARLALPRIDEPGRLTLHVHEREEDLVPGSFGILEPAPDSTPVDPAEVDAVLVPGVAFDLFGHRLGYGGGFYDRLLPLLRPEAPAVGLAFDCQVVAALPAEGHDVALDALVTPTRTLRF